MKNSEYCFLEIINSLTNLKKEKDDGRPMLRSVINWSKCRNFNGLDYIHDGYIKVEDGISLYYFFSNKRSALSLIQETNNDELDINYLQYNLLLYTECLFKSYSIDTFLNNLININ